MAIVLTHMAISGVPPVNVHNTESITPVERFVKSTLPPAKIVVGLAIKSASVAFVESKTVIYPTFVNVSV
jgi:hypothetical protein